MGCQSVVKVKLDPLWQNFSDPLIVCALMLQQTVIKYVRLDADEI